MSEPEEEPLTELLDRLERLAKEATPGPWAVGRLDTGKEIAPIWSEAEDGEVSSVVAMAFPNAPADANYLAALDPQTVLRLVEAAKRHVRWRKEELLAWRRLEDGDACKGCGGAGRRSYPSTATWRGGIGGQAVTTDVCDECWGSGSASRPWPSWRRQE